MCGDIAGTYFSVSVAVVSLTGVYDNCKCISCCGIAEMAIFFDVNVVVTSLRGYIRSVRVFCSDIAERGIRLFTLTLQ